MSEPKLNQTSYAVLGMIALFERVTPYELKQFASISVGYFWTLHQAQLYGEPRRLAKAGYVTEEREDGGRRRLTYAITDEGRTALAKWLEEPTHDVSELREPGLLQLFMGADPVPLARAQADAQRACLEEYEQLAGLELPEGQRLALEAGIRLGREWVNFWEEIAGTRPGGAPV
jgi:DNA-binding PadR family transcriptional regulator